MCTEPLVSVIVPVYNVSDYVAKCLQSLLNQSYLNWEAIVIDDGSTDNSADICRNYANRDERIHFFGKKNGGLSDARNFGLDKAKGKFVAFLDGDDAFHPSFLTLMVAGIGFNEKIKICGCEFCYDQIEYPTYQNVQSHSYTQDETIDLYLKNNRECEESMCNKLFERSLFEDIRFPKGRIHEDTFTLPYLLLKSQEYVFLDFKGYNVTTRKGSITRDVYDLRQYDKVEACRNIVSLLEQTCHYRLAVDKYLGSLLWFIFKTNGRYDNKFAYDELQKLYQQCGFHVSYRFMPFLIAYRVKLLKYIKLK